jgi:hypothetical protein
MFQDVYFYIWGSDRYSDFESNMHNPDDLSRVQITGLHMDTVFQEYLPLV